MMVFAPNNLRSLKHVACALMLMPILVEASIAQEPAVPTVSTFQRCVLTARQVGSDRMEGTIELYPNASTSSGMPAETQLTIGRTNLEQLALSSAGRPIELGADAAGNLIPLSDSPLQTVSGTWERSGTAIGESTSWRFLLPSVAVCEINLETDASTTVTSPDALVISVPTLSGKAKWKLLPANPQDVTIRCTGVSVESSSSKTLSLTGDIAIDSNSLNGTWIVTTDELRSQGSLALRFSSPCEVTDVTFVDKSKTKWTYNQSKRELQVELPSTVSANSLKIAIARNADKGSKRDLPIPAPIQTTKNGNRSSRDNKVRLLSSSLRVRVASSLLIADHDLQGLYERDITWGTDGWQTLELVQFDSTAKAVLLTTPALAILDDATYTVFNPDSSPDEAVVYLNVTAKAGSTGRLDYSIPAEWQVKEVSEVASGQFLLFKMRDEDRGRQRRRFTIWLRSPLIPGAEQRLKLNLLSTESTSVGRYSPRITSTASRRHEVFLATDRSDLSGFGFVPVEQDTNVPEWLPDDASADAELYTPGTQDPRNARVEPATPPPVQQNTTPRTPPEEQETERQSISGTAFQILTLTESGPEAECLTRLHVDAGEQVAFNIPDVTSIQTFVNGRLCYATSSGSTYSVPLDESAGSNVVDVYFTATPGLEKDQKISLPILRPVTDGNGTTSTVVTFAADYQPLIDQRANQSTVEISSVRDLPSEIYRTESAAELEMVVRSFRSRWNVSAGQTALVIHGADNVSEHSLEFRQPLLTPSFMIFWVAVLGLLWATMLRQGWLSLTSQGVCLLLLSITAFFAPSVYQQPITLILLSLLIPVSGAFTLRLLHRLLRNRMPSLKLRRAIGVTTLLSVLPVADVLLGDESTSNAEALIVSCKVAVTLESRQSAMATVDCMTAFPPGRDGRLEIPVDRFTLIDCSIAGQSTLPKRIDDGLLELIIPASTKDGETPTEDAGWLRRSVRYTIRGVPQWTAGVYRLQIPHPVAPATAVSLTDETGLISSAALRGTDVSSRLMGTGRWEFDGASGRETLDLELTGEQATDSSEGEQVVAIQCEADVSPPDLKLSTTYTFSDTGLAGDIVRIGATPQYRITAIQDRSGNNLTWSMSEDSVVVQLDTETDRRALVVRQAGELTLDLKQKISVGRLMTVDDRTATDSTLRVRTSERFFVESVAAGKEALKRSDTTGTVSTPTFRIDSAAKEIQVNLQELRPSREASIFQEAIIGDDEIDWSAECRLKIEVQPVYRQQIELSQSVDLTGITAERDGASLIQAWTRNNDRIVVAFREATRGEVVLRLTGVLQRSKQNNTALPAISLPDADVQEATLELSTAKNTIAMIGDSGSAIPDVNFDAQSDPIPEQPLRMTLTNESQPPDIRLTPVRRLLIESALVIYELGDQPFVAELLRLRPEDARFETRFRLRSDLFAGVQPLAFRNEQSVDITEQGGEFVIPPLESGQEGLPTTIVLGRMDDVESSGEVTTHVPDFDTETQINSWSVFDVRNDRPQQQRDPLPSWVRNGLQIAEVGSETTGVRIPDFNFDDSTMSFRGRVATTGLRPEDRRNRVLSALGTHLVALGDTAGMVRSDFLLFAAEPSPEASLLFPSNAQILELRVNGQPTTVMQQDAYCVIDANEKINHVAIQWVGRIQQGQDGMRLPVVANIVSENIAVLSQSENIGSSVWKPLNPQLTAPEFEAARAAAIRKSLRLVDPASPPAEDFSLETDSAFWDQVSSSSPQAAKSFRESMNAVRTAIADSNAIVNADDRSLALSKPLKPTPLQYAGVIFGGLLIAVSLLKPVKSRKTVDATESAVTEIGESAIVEPSTHSAASSSQLPDDGADPNGSTVAGEDV